MKTCTKINLLMLLAIGPINLYSQNVLPSTGNVGVGTMSPTTPLEVVGDTKLDGRVVVKDSMTVEKRLTIEQDVKVIGKSVFVDDVKAKSDFKVLGNSKLSGTLKMLNYADPNISYNRILKINPNGKVIPGTISLPDPSLPDPNCGTVMPWSTHVDAHNPLNIELYTILCSSYKGVGIGTTTPDATLDVEGSFQFVDGRQPRC